MIALYNEIEPYACDWLENLITAGHIANGRVDRRSIAELSPNDCRGAGETHFFAGVGVWSYALRLAGWPSDVPVWTGSCPCQPFSQAGKRAGRSDQRHLWPEWFRLIRECRPPVILGEQVASPDGLDWLDSVCADLEAEGYAVGAADLSAAGFGAPHIRQRLFFVAHAPGFGRRQGSETATGVARPDAYRRSEPCGVADANPRRLAQLGPTHHDDRCDASGHHADRRSAARDMGDATGPRREGQSVGGAARPGHERASVERASEAGPGGLGNAGGNGTGEHAGELPGDEGEHEERRSDGDRSSVFAGATRGFWERADWLPCSDGKARPVEPGTFPLAPRVAGRVGVVRTVEQGGSSVQEEHWYSATGALKAYGNAINAEVAAGFIRAVMEVCS